MTAAENEAGGLRASDVVAFGQEYGRVLSDGRIIGRPEPFAKVFPSSREVKRTVGVTAWAILEDIALDARVDVEGRLVADTNVWQIADNLGLATNTVAKHLGRLRDHGFVLHEEQRADSSGQYATSRYVLDPSACLERFTHTPINDSRPVTSAETVHSPVGNAVVADRPESATDDGFSPCTNSCDTARQTVSHILRHRDLRHNNKDVVVPEEQQHQTSQSTQSGPAEPPGSVPSPELVEASTSLGISAAQAADLVAKHDSHRVREVVAAAQADDVRNPAGWAVAALTRGWAVSNAPPPIRRPQPPLIDAPPGSPGSSNTARSRSDSGHPDLQTVRGRAWVAAAAELLDDRQLAAFVAAETHGPLASLTVSGPRLLRARIASRLAAVHLAYPGLSLPDAVHRAVNDLADMQMPTVLPAGPHEPVDVDIGGLDARLQQIAIPTRPRQTQVAAMKHPPDYDGRLPEPSPTRLLRPQRRRDRQRSASQPNVGRCRHDRPQPCRRHGRPDRRRDRRLQPRGRPPGLRDGWPRH